MTLGSFALLYLIPVSVIIAFSIELEVAEPLVIISRIIAIIVVAVFCPCLSDIYAYLVVADVISSPTREVIFVYFVSVS